MFKKTIKIMDWISYALLIVFSSAMVISTFLQVIFRYLFNHPLFWSEELSRYCFVWIVFVGAAIAMKQGAHIGVDYFVMKLPSRFKNFLRIVINILIISFLVIIIKQSIFVVIVNMSQYSPAIRIPMGLIYLAIPVGLSLMLGYVIIMNYQLLKSILSYQGKRRQEIK